MGASQDDTSSALKERLRLYVFRELMRAEGSPVRDDIRDLVQQAVRQEVAVMRDEVTKVVMDTVSGVIQDDLVTLQNGMSEAIENALIAYLKNPGGFPQELVDIPQRLDALEEKTGLRTKGAKAARRLPARKGSNHQRLIKLERPRSQWTNKALLALAAVIAAALLALALPRFFSGGEVGAPFGGGAEVGAGRDTGAGQLRGSQDPLPPTDSALIERGWRIVRAQTPAIVTEACLIRRDCAFAEIEESAHPTVAQAAMEVLAVQFGCEGAARRPDGVFDANTQRRFSAIVECVGARPETVARCGSPCRFPSVAEGFPRASERTWVWPLTAWALALIATNAS